MFALPSTLHLSGGVDERVEQVAQPDGFLGVNEPGRRDGRLRSRGQLRDTPRTPGRPGVKRFPASLAAVYPSFVVGSDRTPHRGRQRRWNTLGGRAERYPLAGSRDGVGTIGFSFRALNLKLDAGTGI